MDRKELRLVRTPQTRGPRERWAAPALGVAVLAAGALATGAGADRARAPFDPASIAEAGLAGGLAGDPEAIPSAAARLAARLACTPLDTATRTIYASLLAETAIDGAGREHAAAEVRLAVANAPHDEGARRAEVKVLARTGDAGGAIRATRALFDLAPDHAALVLSEIEPLLPPRSVEDAIPDDPGAWLARSIRQREAGDVPAADARLAALILRWPDALAARRIAGSVAAGRGDDAGLLAAVPPDLAIVDSRENAGVLVLRGRSRALTGDTTGALRDVHRALELAPGDPWITVAAGDAAVGLDPALARTCFLSGLYELPAARRAGGQGAAVLARIARLDEREGRAADGLRRWREVLAIDPAHAEAMQRVAALTGGGASPLGTPRR